MVRALLASMGNRRPFRSRQTENKSDHVLPPTLGEKGSRQASWAGCFSPLTWLFSSPHPHRSGTTWLQGSHTTTILTKNMQPRKEEPVVPQATVLLKEPNPARVIHRKMDEAGRSLPDFQPFATNTKGFLHYQMWW